VEVKLAVSKIRKYATSSSGDTVEVVERPNGGVSVVMADGQSSGRGAKYISTLVVRYLLNEREKSLLLSIYFLLISKPIL
jgi:hypothetical protein